MRGGVIVPVVALLGAFVYFAMRGPGSERAQLIEVHDVSPKSLEPNETLRIVGRGFPDGKKAYVHFAGEAHRPSGTVGLDVRAIGRVQSSSDVELELDASLVGGLIGPAHEHVTFEGTVEVAFEAFDPKAQPVVGAKPGVVLDLRPVRSLEDTRASRKRAIERWSSLGVQLEERQVDEGSAVFVAAVTSGARDLALAPGDRIARASGILVATIDDLDCAGDEHDLELIRGDEHRPAQVAFITPRRWTERMEIPIGLAFFLLPFLFLPHRLGRAMDDSLRTLRWRRGSVPSIVPLALAAVLSASWWMAEAKGVMTLTWGGLLILLFCVRAITRRGENFGAIAFFDLLTVLLALLSGSAVNASTHFGEAVRSQTESGWAAFRHPAALATFALLAFGTGRSATLLDDAIDVFLSFGVVMLLLGGDGVASDRLAGWTLAILLAKVTTVVLLRRSFAPRESSLRSSILKTFFAGLAFAISATLASSTRVNVTAITMAVVLALFAHACVRRLLLHSTMRPQELEPSPFQ